MKQVIDFRHRCSINELNVRFSLNGFAHFSIGSGTSTFGSTTSTTRS